MKNIVFKYPPEFHIASFNLPELVDLNTYINAERSQNRNIASNIKKQQTELVKLWIKKQNIKHYKRIESIIFIWYHKNKRKDFDNVEFSQKFIRDGMVASGIIPNDGWKHFPPTTLHQHRYIPDTQNGCTVLIKGELL